MSAIRVRERQRLGGAVGVAEITIVFRCEDAFEIDHVGGYDVETQRVFFGDVLLITLHKQFSRFGLWFMGISTLIGLLIWLFSPNQTLAFWLGFAPNLPFLAMVLVPYAHITIFGKRTKAVMRWHFRHARARAVYDEVVALVRQAQERERADHQARSPLSASSLPLPPAEATAPDEAPTPAVEPMLGDGRSH